MYCCLNLELSGTVTGLLDERHHIGGIFRIPRLVFVADLTRASDLAACPEFDEKSSTYDLPKLVLQPDQHVS